MEKDMAIIQGIIITMACGGLFLVALGVQLVYAILPVISMLLSGFAIYYSKLIKDAEIVVVKGNIRAKFYCKFSNNLFKDGKLNINPVFFNRGDKESIVYIEDFEIQNLDCYWIISPAEHTEAEFLTIKPQSPLEVKVEASFRPKKPTSKDFLSSINKIQLKYHWIKEDTSVPCTEDILISFEIIDIE